MAWKPALIKVNPQAKHIFDGQLHGMETPNRCFQVPVLSAFDGQLHGMETWLGNFRVAVSLNLFDGQLHGMETFLVITKNPSFIIFDGQLHGMETSFLSSPALRRWGDLTASSMAWKPEQIHKSPHPSAAFDGQLHGMETSLFSFGDIVNFIFDGQLHGMETFSGGYG